MWTFVALDWYLYLCFINRITLFWPLISGHPSPSRALFDPSLAVDIIPRRPRFHWPPRVNAVEHRTHTHFKQYKRCFTRLDSRLYLTRAANDSRLKFHEMRTAVDGCVGVHSQIDIFFVNLVLGWSTIRFFIPSTHVWLLLKWWQIIGVEYCVDLRGVVVCFDNYSVHHFWWWLSSAQHPPKSSFFNDKPWKQKICIMSDPLLASTAKRKTSIFGGRGSRVTPHESHVHLKWRQVLSCALRSRKTLFLMLTVYFQCLVIFEDLREIKAGTELWCVFCWLNRSKRTSDITWWYRVVMI